jgi:hypothetical protein
MGSSQAEKFLAQHIRRGVALCVTAKSGHECRLWVKSRHQRMSASCPLYPQKQTLELSHAMSALCQNRTHALQQFAVIRSAGRVGAAKHRKQYGKAKCLTGFQIERWKGISIDKNFKFDAAQQLPASGKLFQF